MRLAQKDGRIDEERAARQIRYAIDRGVNYIDTAWPYHGGESEPFVGRALAGGYRERVKLATKLPAWLVKNRADMDRFLDAQLRETGHLAHRLLPGPLAQWSELGPDGGARRRGVSRPGQGRRTDRERRLLVSRDCARISNASSTPIPGSSARFNTTISTRSPRPAPRGCSTPPSKGLGVIVDGAAARRRAGRFPAAAGHRRPLARGRTAPDPCRVGAALGLEPPGSDRGSCRG